MAKTIDELKAQSAEIKNATVVGENTATRVGTLFNDIVEHIEQVTADGATTTQKLAPLAVTTEKLADSVKQAIIYDVSAHNNGAVFESFSALLRNSDLDTIIPVSFRYGGMSIRFIQGYEQSSDNKYVQYRYMESDATTAATFTNVANWQGVDDEPTDRSENLLKSGGVWNFAGSSKRLPNGLMVNSSNELREKDYKLINSIVHYNIINNHEHKYFKIGHTGKTSGGIIFMLMDVKNNIRLDWQATVPETDYSGIKTYTCIYGDNTKIEVTIDWNAYNLNFGDGYYSDSEVNYNGIFVETHVDGADAIPLIHRDIQFNGQSNFVFPIVNGKRYYIRIDSDDIFNLLNRASESAYTNVFGYPFSGEVVVCVNNNISNSLLIQHAESSNISPNVLILEEGTFAFEQKMHELFNYQSNGRFTKDDCSILGILDYNGVIQSHSECKVSKYVPITGASKIVLKNFWQAGATYYTPFALYDKSLNFVGRAKEGEVNMDDYPTAEFMRFFALPGDNPMIDVYYKDAIAKLEISDKKNKNDIADLKNTLQCKTKSISYNTGLERAEYYRGGIYIHRNAMLEDSLLKQVKFNTIYASIGQTVTFYAGTVLQVHDMPQYEDGQFLFTNVRSYTFTLTDDNFTRDLVEEWAILDVFSLGIQLREGECLGFGTEVFIARTAQKNNNMLHAANLNDAFDKYYDMCKFEMELETLGDVYAKEYKIDSIEKDIDALSVDVSKSNIIVDKTTGTPYKIAIDNGQIILQSLLLNDVFVFGSSQVLHGESPVLPYYRKGGESMVPSIAGNSFIQIVRRAIKSKNTQAEVSSKHASVWETSLYTVNRDGNNNITGYTKTVFDFATMFADIQAADVMYMFLLGNTSFVYDSDATKAMLYKLIKEQCISLFEYLHSKFPTAEMYANYYSGGEVGNVLKNACDELSYVHYIPLTNLWINNHWEPGDWYAETDENSNLYPIVSRFSSHAYDVWDYEAAKSMLAGNYYTPVDSVYNVILNNIEGGIISAPFTISMSPAIITIRCNADNGKYINGLTVRDRNGNDITSLVGLKLHVTDSGVTYTFKMPANDVVVTPSWGTTRNYIPRTITINTVTGGTCVVYSNTMIAGDIYKVYLQPDSGKTENGISVSPSLSVTNHGDGVYSFIMPDNDITVTPLFT